MTGSDLSTETRASIEQFVTDWETDNRIPGAAVESSGERTSASAATRLPLTPTRIDEEVLVCHTLGVDGFEREARVEFDDAEDRLFEARDRSR